MSKCKKTGSGLPWIAHPFERSCLYKSGRQYYISYNRGLFLFKSNNLCDFGFFDSDKMNLLKFLQPEFCMELKLLTTLKEPHALKIPGMFY